MDINDSFLFVKIAETLSFKDAASQLGISRSSASKRIALLEKEIGTVLLNRSPRSISLTPAGLIFLKYCKAICENMDEARSALANEDDEPRGRLKFSIPASLGSVLMPSLAHEFSQKYPLISFEANFGDPNVDIIGGGYDVAIKIARRLPDSNLMARRLATTPQVLAASPGYLAAHAELTHVRELDNHACVGVTPGKRRVATWNFAGTDGPHSVSVEYVFASNSDLAVNIAARSGMGYIYAPELLIRSDLMRGRLISVLPEFCKDLDCGVYALYPKKQPPAKVRLFIDFIQEKLVFLGQD